MKFKTHHYIIIIAAVIGIFLYGKYAGSPLTNADLNDNPVVQNTQSIFTNKMYAITLCDDKLFKAYGPLTNNQKCTTTQDCTTYWPAGPSYQIRDQSTCCVDTGLCGVSIE